ncbi:GIY-YIG nuclease family protein [Vibrio splendidus]|nr:GIY-YIG nuclease family protein [Vibrio splendidus]MCC4881498.1 GIY-YIG nuclease family protein [Vibrio splendidus]
MKGLVYILQNPAMQGFLKIGVTTDINQRLSSLYTTGVPLPFAVAFQKEILDSYNIESKIFEKLNYCRATDAREFFIIDVDSAITVIEEACEQIEGAYVDDDLDKYYNVWTCPD